jgi:nucleotide-binding universal stress UspA family protein
MTAPIVVGVDGTDCGLDAVALAARLARATADPLLLVCVYPEEPRPGARVDAEIRRHADAALDAARAELDGAAAELRATASTSPARGLAELAERDGAAAVVVGSSSRGAIGRVLSGGTAERLLHGSGCPVAVAPRGYRRHAGPLGALAAAFIDTPEGHEAVRVAAGLAASSGLPLTLHSVIAVSTNWFVPPAVRREEEALVPEEVRQGYRKALDEALARVPGGVRASGELHYGDVVDELSMLGERGADLLVCGSRRYGPVRRVLLGSVSSALVRQASLPVLVAPRGDAEARAPQAGA